MTFVASMLAQQSQRKFRPQIIDIKIKLIKYINDIFENILKK